jgi:hypothetical protein
VTKKTSRRGRDKEEPNAVGRPRTKLEDLHPDWRDIMLALYNGGAADAEVSQLVARGSTRFRAATGRDAQYLPVCLSLRPFDLLKSLEGALHHVRCPPTLDAAKRLNRFSDALNTA